MGKVSEGTLAVCYAVQCPAKVDIVCVHNQVVVQPCMGIPLKEFLHYEIHTKGPEDGSINGSCLIPLEASIVPINGLKGM